MRRLSLILGLCLSSAVSIAAGINVDRFSPQGSSKNVRQVQAHFNLPVVTLGNNQAPAPFEIQCAVPGSGRWLDAQNWVYDFEREMPGGVSCRFSISATFRSANGAPLTAASFSFNTGGPMLRESRPNGSLDLANGESVEMASIVDEEQVFLLQFDSPLKPGSLTNNSWCEVDGVRERINTVVLNGPEREAVLKKLFREPAKQPFELLRCQRKLPAGQMLRLVLGKDLRAGNDVPAGELQRLYYRVRPAFNLSVGCERSSAQSNCLPILPLTLRFSAPVAWSSASKIVLKDSEGRLYSPQGSDDSRTGWVQQLRFRGPFPEKSTLTPMLPADLRDDANRPLSNLAAASAPVKIDAYPPLAKFSGSFGIVEANAGALLPVTVRNLTNYLPADNRPPAGPTLNPVPTAPAAASPAQGALYRLLPNNDEQQVIQWLRKGLYPQPANDKDTRQPEEISVLKGVNGILQGNLPTPTSNREAEVIGIPLQRLGFHVVEIESPRLGAQLLESRQPMYVRTTALNTNMAVHLKLGEESSLVWVTTLDKAFQVPNASISVRDCNGQSLWSGKTDKNGMAWIRQPLGGKQWGCPKYVFARSNDDFSFARSDWDNGIEAWRFNLPGPDWRGPNAFHSIFDRSLLRVGDTVYMKHLARKRVSTGFTAADTLPTTLEIRHYGSGQEYQLPLKWNNGTAESSWKIPPGAALGEYGVTLLRKEKDGQQQWQSGSFRVGEFRVPLMRGVVALPKSLPANAREVPVELQVNHLSGGGAASLPATLRAQVRPKYVFFPDYQDFVFANGDVSAEMKKGGLKSAGLQVEQGDYFSDDAEQPAELRELNLPPQTLALDAKGAGRVVLRELPQATEPRELVAELEYADPNGERQTSRASMPLWSSSWLPGVQVKRFANRSEPSLITALVLDQQGKPVANAPVQVNAYLSKNYSHRKRLIGGFYAYENQIEYKPLGVLCNSKTNASGKLECKFFGKESGDITIRVGTKDPEGRYAFAHREFWWSAGDDGNWFGGDSSDRIELIADRKQYQPGQTASIQVRMPFQSATVLVSVEREGVIEAFSHALNARNPVVKVPIKPSYGPNVFVSVLAVRARVPGMIPTAMVDLGKPSYRLGITELQVGQRAYALDVQVAADKPLYQARDVAKVQVKVKTADGKPLPKGAEVALAAVDEGLLALAPNASWDVLQAMVSRRGYGVSNATAQMQVIGRRHFGKKALPAGGGGGKAPTRELFDTLLLWKGRVPLNDAGEATVDVPLNDSLTSFRIVAVATAGTERFGSGATSIRASKDLLLLAGLPPVVRDGDVFRAGFTLRNTTERSMSVEVSPSLSADGKTLPLANQSATLAAGEAREIGWDVTVPLNSSKLDWRVEVRERDGRGNDAIKLGQTVLPALPVRVQQASLQLLDQPLNLPLAAPPGALPGRGGVAVSLMPSPAQLDGVRQYMSQYPYACLEQRTSKAVALGNSELWAQISRELPGYLDEQGLARYFPNLQQGSVELTAYLLSISHEAGWEIPAQAQQKMQGALAAFVAGKLRVAEWGEPAKLKLMALEALSRTGKLLPNQLDSLSLQPANLSNRELLDWISILQHSELPSKQDKLQTALQLLRNRLNVSGTALSFAPGNQDWWALASDDSDAVRALLLAQAQPEWQSDLPKLLSGALAKQQQGHWDLTTANAWGALALGKLGKLAQAPAGSTLISLAGQQHTQDWAKQPNGGRFDLPWPAAKAELQVRHQGSGVPWVNLTTRAAVPLSAPVAAGYRISRNVAPVQQAMPGKWSRGDIARVTLDIEARGDMGWVVVNDPVPAGATLLNRGFGSDSLAAGRNRNQGAWPQYVEAAHDAYRAYYNWLPSGKWQLEYSVRLNNSGVFQLPPTRVEAMYAPDLYGEVPNATITVE